MRKLIVSLVAVLVTSFANFSLADTIPPEIKKVVTFIFLADTQGNLMKDPTSGNPLPYGTGFFVFVKNPSGTGGYGYLVTAKHVLKSPNGDDLSRVFLRLDKKQGDAEFVAINLVENGKSVVYTHSDPTVDIAVVPALPPSDIYDFKMIPEEMLSDADSFKQFNIAEGTEVFFTGLFISHYGDHHNEPIVRFGRVSMLPKERIAWQEDAAKPAQYAELYLLETQSYGGNSGSPVFFYLGSDRIPGSIIVGSPVVKLAGIMKGSFNENRAIRFVQPSAAMPIPISSQNIGIAAVTPSYLLHEILFSPALMKARADNPILMPAHEK